MARGGVDDRAAARRRTRPVRAHRRRGGGLAPHRGPGDGVHSGVEPHAAYPRRCRPLLPKRPRGRGARGSGGVPARDGLRRGVRPRGVRAQRAHSAPHGRDRDGSDRWAVRRSRHAGAERLAHSRDDSVVRRARTRSCIGQPAGGRAAWGARRRRGGATGRARLRRTRARDRGTRGGGRRADAGHGGSQRSVRHPTVRHGRRRAPGRARRNGREQLLRAGAPPTVPWNVVNPASTPRGGARPRTDLVDH